VIEQHGEQADLAARLTELTARLKGGLVLKERAS
jgi:hypothetical protein